MMKKGLGGIMKQAQAMQSKMLAIQEETAQQTVEASAGGGMITAVVNGKQELLSLKINPDAVDPEDVEMLEDMVSAAINKALEDSRQMVKDALASVTGGLNIPGMF